MEKKMNEVLEKIKKIGIVPVVVLDDAKDAKPLAKALIEGGLPCAEVTFRTAAAEEAIKIMASEYPDMLVGAGTVLTTEQADRAIAAGAKFIVAPGLNPEVVKYCLEKNVPMVPGVNNPSDIETALSLGLTTVKFFPAEQSGGIKMIKALAAPYVNVTFMPTGGINADNICDYLSFDRIIACGGSWMVKKDLVAAGKFDEIKALTEQAVRTMLGFYVKHVGLNLNSKEEAYDTCKTFEDLFGFMTRSIEISSFAGGSIEAMNEPGPGTHGHIAIGTNNVERAVNYLSTVKGVKFREDSKTYKDGKLNLIYLEKEIGGFAIHLVTK